MSEGAAGLVVPMRLEVLPIGAGDATVPFAPPYATFSRLPYQGGSQGPYLGALALNSPWTGTAPLPQGLHLHWHLPRALRRGVYDDAGRLTMPPVPDRWLITRVIARASDASLAIRSWVIESTFLWSDATYSPSSVPADPHSQQPFAYLGRAYDLADWLHDGERGHYEPDLTALGFGIPDFAGCYPNCRNVFGFLDDTLNAGFDPDAATLAYAVTGWYATQSNDPVQGQPLSGDDNPLGWRFTADGSPPAYSLCHGAVLGIDWNPAAAYLTDHGTDVAPEVAIGNHPPEAFSALAVARLGTEAPPGAEQLLNAVQLGKMDDVSQTGGLAEIEHAVFDTSFATLDEGLVWDVKPAAPALPGQARAALDALPTTVAGDLSRLNEVEDALVAADATATALRAQIFADWCTFMWLQYSTSPPPSPTVDDVYGLIEEELTALEALTGIGGKIEELSREAATLSAALKAALPPALDLVSMPAPRYYQPTEPVVVLAGDGVPGRPPGEAGPVDCLLTTQLATAISLPAQLIPGSAAETLPASDLPSVPDAQQLPHPAAAALVGSLMLLDPDAAPALAAGIAALGGADNPAVMDREATEDAISSAQQAWLAGAEPPSHITLEGSPLAPDIALRAWVLPWEPVALGWRCALQAVRTAPAASGTNYPERFVLDAFKLGPTYLNLELDPGQLSERLQIYTGVSLLSPDTTISLRSAIEDYLKVTEDEELAQILTELGNEPFLAQTLGDFGAASVMLDPTLQLPVADPLADDPIYGPFSNETVPRAVGDQNRTAPLVDNAYHPLRAGRLAIERLVLVDAFGRIRGVNLDRLVVAESIPTDGGTPPALLPPLRVTQPARLDFRWRAAADPGRDASSLPGMSPLCGWVVPNHLDGSVMLYDGSGAAIGTLTPTPERVAWQRAPGAGPADEGLADSLKDCNEVIAEFAQAVYAHGPAALEALVRTFDRTNTFIAPRTYAQDRQTAVLMGAPVALVQAALDLTLMGMPAADQSLAAVAADARRGDPLRRTTRGFDDVRFPVVLGSLTEFDDGLVGFFLGAGADTDFGVLYAAAADSSDPAHIARPKPDTVLVSPSATSPVLLTLLVDPRCPVHAFTGIGQVKALTVPPEPVARALAAMAFTFLTSPVLTGPGPFAMPTPDEAGGDWTWVTYAAGQWVETAIAPVDAKATMRTPTAISEGWLKLTPKGG